MTIDASSFARCLQAVVVGVSQYPEAGPDRSLKHLPGCVPGARNLSNALCSPKFCRVPSDQVDCLDTPARTTRQKVLESLAAAASRAKDQDIVFFFFTGHGLDRNDGFCLATSEATRDAKAETCVTADDIVRAISATKARGVLLILDCCGGAALAERAPRMFSDLGDRFEFRIFLSASKRGQSSYDLEREGSPFTNLLITAISGGLPTIGKQGEIYFGALFEFIRNEMEKLFASRLKGLDKQEPVVFQHHLKEPLIFVNSDVSLKAIELNLYRYTTRDLKNRILFALISVAASIASGLIALWTWIDQHQYVELLPPSSVAIFRGYPRMGLFGYPHPIWQLDLKTLDIAAGSSLAKYNHLAMPKKANPYEVILTQLNRLGKSRILLQTAQYRRAEQEAKEFLASIADVQGEMRYDAKDVIISSASPGHTQLIESLTEESQDVHDPTVLTAALRKIAAIDFNLLEIVLAKDGLESPSRFDKNIVYPQFPPTCTPGIHRYLERAMGKEWAFNPAQADMLLRTRCPLPAVMSDVDWERISLNQLYLRRILNPSRDTDRLLGTFMQFVDTISAELVDRTKPPSGEPRRIASRLAQALDALVALDALQTTCDDRVIDLIALVTSSEPVDEDEKAGFARYVTRYCRNSRISLHLSDTGDPELRDGERRMFAVSATILTSPDIRALSQWSRPIIERVALVQVGGRLRASDKVDWVPFVQTDETGVELIERIAASDDPSLQTAALVWMFRHKRDELTGLIRRLGHRIADDSILEAMPAIHSDKDLALRIFSTISESAQREILQVKWRALWGNSAEVLSLLASPDLQVRRAAADCLAFRDDISVIRNILVVTQSQVVDFVIQKVDKAQREHDRLILDIGSIPDAERGWRAELEFTETLGGQILLRTLIAGDDLHIR